MTVLGNLPGAESATDKPQSMKVLQARMLEMKITEDFHG